MGDKLREVLRTGDISIRWYDESADLVHSLYCYEHGDRLNLPPTARIPGGAFERERQTRQPGRSQHVPMRWRASALYPGTDRALCDASIPIISGDRFLGDLHVENFERENAFGESELRLLTTIAASLGTALENARARSRPSRSASAELQIINSIQQGLAAELDFQAIVDLVGDKLREVLRTGDIGIRWYDEATNLRALPLRIRARQAADTCRPSRPTPGGAFRDRCSRPGSRSCITHSRRWGTMWSDARNRPGPVRGDRAHRQQ